jgi:UDP-N-acetylglucosamine--N-acetylmuramyl-(pentapeptide) pyrophosphoryl-undecaprenol N-acetylglucosamine transferase
MGGSLGAKSINDGVAAALSRWDELGINLLWQTGKRFAAENEKRVAEQGLEDTKVLGFIDRMDYAYAAADLIISRAGAMSIAELALIGKATVFVPSPNVSEDHQTHNARSLTDSGAALLLADSQVRTELEQTVVDLINDEPRRNALGTAIRQFARPNAAAAVVDQLERIARK